MRRIFYLLILFAFFNSNIKAQVITIKEAKIEIIRKIYILNKIKIIMIIRIRCQHMIEKPRNIWFWLQNGEIYKSVSFPDDGIICIYDQQDNLILKRKGLSKLQIKRIEDNIIKYGAKKVKENAEPFRFLGK